MLCGSRLKNGTPFACKRPVQTPLYPCLQLVALMGRSIIAMQHLRPEPFQSMLKTSGCCAAPRWSWDICADTCAICRNSLNEPSIEYQANPSPNNENGLSIAFGTCGHDFHLDCIQRWLKTRSVCPLCNKEWDFSKIERIPGYGSGS